MTKQSYSLTRILMVKYTIEPKMAARLEKTT